MSRNIEWMFTFIPTVIGAIILGLSLFTSADPILHGYLHLVSLSSMVQNMLKNSLEFMKYLVGPGG